MSRNNAIAAAEHHLDSGGLFDDLARRVSHRTESQDVARRPELLHYLTDEVTPTLERLGFSAQVFDNPRGPDQPPLLVAHRNEAAELPTVFGYGHGDVVRGYDDQWDDGRSPWVLEVAGDRWYGRGTADNKGQHTINIAALEAVLGTRGRLGFNATFLVETGEETGSPGLREFCAANRELLEADVLLASDGPRLLPEQATVFMGTRGAVNFDMTIELRAGGHHSGNWGGLLANPAIILSHAIASITSAAGEIRVPEMRPPELPDSVRAAIHDLPLGGEGTPQIDPCWGEPGLTPSERVFGWNSFEVLSFTAGNPDKPANAVPPRASAHCQIRFVVPCDPHMMLDGLRRHLADNGFDDVSVTISDEPMMATRLDPQHPWAQWAATSIETTTGLAPTLLPNLGGSLPNEVFAGLLELPTLWVPHSYGGCSQHSPNEHILDWMVRDALRIMTGLYWDLGEPGARELLARSPTD
ncbi:MAG: M20 family metallopeptidase [Actinomycetia bacterium]|nr:M20 family metallopeptidase [Actinomycetes bacterium]MCP4963445.1 M20 family metallopeptidase [Actinomycetes bacterium]